MPRFYLAAELAEQDETALPEAVVRHIQVLRLRAGERLTLFNGNGREYAAELTHIGRREAHCRILSEHSPATESPLAVTLVQAVSAPDKMEYALQKSTELGVAAIQPVISERSIGRLSGERADKRLKRWQDIVTAACEQSGRNRIPPVRPPLPLRDYLGLSGGGAAPLRLIMSLNRPAALTLFAQPARVDVMIGPEGGWTAAEEADALAAGFAAFSLGPRTLRTETAAAAALSAMQLLWGDFA